jgi:hypothetical protein
MVIQAVLAEEETKAWRQFQRSDHEQLVVLFNTLFYYVDHLQKDNTISL